MSQYSPQLIQMAMEIFKEEDGLLLSEEQAIDALEAYADLFLAFVDKKAPAACAPEPSMVVISKVSPKT